MQADEVATVEREDRTALSRGKCQDARIGNALLGLAGLLSG